MCIGPGTGIANLGVDSIPQVIGEPEGGFRLDDHAGDVDGTGMGIVYGSHRDELSGGGGPCVVETGGGSGIEVASKRAVVIRVPAETIDELVGATSEGVFGGKVNGVRISDIGFGSVTIRCYTNSISVNCIPRFRKCGCGDKTCRSASRRKSNLHTTNKSLYRDNIAGMRFPIDIP